MLITWLLIVFPLFILASALLGAWIYHKGGQGQSPGLSMPRWGVTKRGQENGERESITLPDV